MTQASLAEALGADSCLNEVNQRRGHRDRNPYMRLKRVSVIVTCCKYIVDKPFCPPVDLTKTFYGS